MFRRVATVVVVCLAVAFLCFVLFELGLAIVTPPGHTVLITPPPT